MTEFQDLVESYKAHGLGYEAAVTAVLNAYNCAEPSRWRPIWLTDEFVADLARRCGQRTGVR